MNSKIVSFQLNSQDCVVALCEDGSMWMSKNYLGKVFIPMITSEYCNKKSSKEPPKAFVDHGYEKFHGVFNQSTPREEG